MDIADPLKIKTFATTKAFNISLSLKAIPRIFPSESDFVTLRAQSLKHNFCPATTRHQPKRLKGGSKNIKNS